MLVYIDRVNSTNTEFLFERLRALGADIPEGAVLRPTYVTRSSRRAGAWAWYLTDSTGRDLNIGSQFTNKELLQSALLLHHDSNGNLNVKIDFKSRPMGQLDPMKSPIGQ